MMLPLMGIEPINACEMAFATVQQRGDLPFSERALSVDVQASERFTALLEEGNALTKEALGVCERLILRSETAQEDPLSDTTPIFTKPATPHTRTAERPLSTWTPTDFLKHAEGGEPLTALREQSHPVRIQVPAKETAYAPVPEMSQPTTERPMQTMVGRVDLPQPPVAKPEEQGIAPERLVAFGTTPIQRSHQPIFIKPQPRGRETTPAVSAHPLSEFQPTFAPSAFVPVASPTPLQTVGEVVQYPTVETPLAQVVILEARPVEKTQPHAMETTRVAFEELTKTESSTSPVITEEAPIETPISVGRPSRPMSSQPSHMALPVEQKVTLEQSALPSVTPQVARPVREVVTPIAPETTVASQTTVGASLRPMPAEPLQEALPVEPMAKPTPTFSTQGSVAPQVARPVREEVMPIAPEPVVAPQTTFGVPPRPMPAVPLQEALPVEPMAKPTPTFSAQGSVMPQVARPVREVVTPIAPETAVASQTTVGVSPRPMPAEPLQEALTVEPMAKPTPTFSAQVSVMPQVARPVREEVMPIAPETAVASQTTVGVSPTPTFSAQVSVAPQVESPVASVVLPTQGTSLWMAGEIALEQPQQPHVLPVQPMVAETRSHQAPAVLPQTLPATSVLKEGAVLAQPSPLPTTVQPEITVQAERGAPVVLQQAVTVASLRGREMDSTLPEPLQVIAPTMLPITLPHQTVESVAQPLPTQSVAQHFVLAAQAVADALLVSSGFVRGEGQLLVRLRPEVLSGSEIRLVATGGTLTVIVHPATQDVQTIVEANRTQFEQYLAEKVQSWRLAVTVKRGGNDDERL